MLNTSIFFKRILSYESWCGGVPCPDVCDNPLGYKFSWSPLAALNALKNEALFLYEGKVFYRKSSNK